jgi:putative AlgH/UPF0301 family transcriptional regulator
MGLILNKRSQMSVSDFTEQLGPRMNIPGFIYLGGPVNIKALTMLHSSEWECSNTMQVNDQFAISSAEDLLVRLADGDAPRHFRLFLGLCGWAPKQLMEELKGTQHHPAADIGCIPCPHDGVHCESNNPLGLK